MVYTFGSLADCFECVLPLGSCEGFSYVRFPFFIGKGFIKCKFVLKEVVEKSYALSSCGRSCVEFPYCVWQIYMMGFNRS